jgi:hypothetical protein
VEQRRKRRGQISQSVITAGKLIPVFGQFIGAGDELYQIWYGDPKAEEALRTDVLDRAAELIDAYRGDVEARFATVGDQLMAQLNMLTDLAERRAISPPLAAAYYAELLNEGLIGGRALPQAEFAARHLNELDVDVLMHLYDRVDFRDGPWYPDDYYWGHSLPDVTVFESAYELARLQTYGFFCLEPDTAAERVGQRGYLPQLDVIGDFVDEAGLMRVVTISPQLEEDQVPRDLYFSGGQFYLSKLTLGGGAVRWHVVKGYQWAVRDYYARRTGAEGGGDWNGAFSTAAEAQAAAEEELHRRNMPVNWMPVAA